MTTYYTDGLCFAKSRSGIGGVIRDLQPYILGSEDGDDEYSHGGQSQFAALKDANMRRAYSGSGGEFWDNVVTKWAPGWEKDEEGEIKNLDIVRELYELYSNSQADLRWARGS